MDQLRFRVGGGDSGELLEPAALFAKELVELLVALGQRQLTSAQSLGAARGFAFALLEQVVFAIELSFAVGDLTLLPLHLFASAADFDFPFLTKPYQLFLSTDDGALAEALPFALRFVNDSLGCLFRGCMGLLLAPDLGAPSDPSPDIENNRAGNYEQKYAGCGYPRRVRHLRSMLGPRQSHRRPLSRRKVVA